MKVIRNKNVIDFVERNFEIHGEFEGVVYHEKRNGEQEKYPYEPVSYYKRTALTIRNEWIRRYTATISNPRKTDYRSIIRKLNYYTPYILAVGVQQFSSETVFYVRDRGDYEFRWKGMPVGIIRKLGRRTKVELSFWAEGEFELEIYYQGALYCQRNFIITDTDLDTAYDLWLGSNIAMLVELPEPEYESLKTYRRGMRSKVNWVQAITGKYHNEVVYEVSEYNYKDSSKLNPWLYHRRKYDHRVNMQTKYFNQRMVEMGSEWQLMSQQKRDEWNKEAAITCKQRLTGFNLYTKTVLRR